MQADIIKYAFVGGEVAEGFHGRTDLEKYDLALADSRNVFVDYRGGLSNRGGTELVDFIMEDDKDVAIWPFKFAANIANTYLVLFGHEYIRFVQDGAYILEALQTITGVTQALPAVVTCAGHGYLADEWIRVTGIAGMTELNGRTFRIGSVTPNTFTLHSTIGTSGTAVDSTDYGAYVSGGQVGRIYTVASIYDSTDLYNLRVSQKNDLLRITHKNYPTYNLIRNSSNDWDFVEEERGRAIDRPTGLTATYSGSTTTWGTCYAVTAVTAEGEESLQSEFVFMLTGDPIDDPGWMGMLAWTAVDGAKYYRVYRSRNVFPAASLSQSLQLGYIGRANGPQFHDPNIVPDFSITPPEGSNPFADKKIEFVNVTAGGSNYTRDSVVTVTDATGSGFVGYPVVGTTPSSSTGPVTAIVIIDGGRDYTAPVISVSVGSGATFTADLTSASGNNPALSLPWQQRQVYSGTDNEPLGIFGSKPGKYSNFDTSIVLKSTDSYEHVLEVEDFSPIIHVVTTRAGLLFFTATSVILFTGGDAVAVTPTNAAAEPQLESTCTNLIPLKINSDILYAEYGRVNLLNYTENSRVYSPIDISRLANHLFKYNNPLITWCFASEPYKWVFATRKDGSALILSMAKEDDVFAWTKATTQGLFYRTASLQEGSVESIYTVVTRWFRGNKIKTLERFVPRVFDHVEDAWFVDCGLSLSSTSGTGTLSVVTESTGKITANTESAYFSLADVGKVIRVSGMKATIERFISTTQVQLAVSREATKFIPETTTVLPSDIWTIDTPVTVITNLYDYEGMELTGLFDGNVLTPQVVENGRITLPFPATRVILGLSYRASAKNLPLTLAQSRIENKRKRITGIAVRVMQTRGLKVGRDENTLREFPERANELYGEPTDLQRGLKVVALDPNWKEDNQEVFVQDYPLPFTILGYVAETEIGDDDR